SSSFISSTSSIDDILPASHGGVGPLDGKGLGEEALVSVALMGEALSGKTLAGEALEGEEECPTRCLEYESGPARTGRCGGRADLEMDPLNIRLTPKRHWNTKCCHDPNIGSDRDMEPRTTNGSKSTHGMKIITKELHQVKPRSTVCWVTSSESFDSCRAFSIALEIKVGSSSINLACCLSFLLQLDLHSGKILTGEEECPTRCLEYESGPARTGRCGGRADLEMDPLNIRLTPNRHWNTKVTKDWNKGLISHLNDIYVLFFLRNNILPLQ
ncbi:hypothetical protein HAX54_035540, partial [Datura stramonium]|nr:hypothetical protein [Datura stramonium]